MSDNYLEYKGDNRRGELDIEHLKALVIKSIKVVNWYPHHDSVRGPFSRWFNVTDVNEEYREKVARKEDDAKYAAAAMNFMPHLIEEIQSLTKKLERCKEVLELVTTPVQVALEGGTPVMRYTEERAQIGRLALKEIWGEGDA